MKSVNATLPPRIEDVDHLEDLLSEPSPGAVEVLGRLEGDLIVLGAGGKMGPTLARMARRASDQAGRKRRVIAVSRFSSSAAEASLRSAGVETVSCDLLDAGQVERLPDAPNVVFMAGMKFGTSTDPARSWAMNTFVPSLVCRKFRTSRVVAFSTGNVYGMCPVVRGGSLETDPPEPVGEYAITALGRERMFQYFSAELKIPVVLLRLNYAMELRYGVIVDIARKVRAGEEVDLTMGCFNVIWQADANAMALQAFDHVATPAAILNLAGPELMSVRTAAEQLGAWMGVEPRFTGSEAAQAFLSNGQLSHCLMGYPRVGVRRMMEWVADWVKRGGATLGKPTHFEVRDGTY
jgi:nucleoside-diphosphate-sugar epimerase